MELYHGILAAYYAEHGYLDQLVDGNRIVRDECYQALCRIREILYDDSLEDPECFQKIEQIICTLEETGLDAGTRHDFG